MSLKSSQEQDPLFSEVTTGIYKVVNDPVHGHLELHPVLMAVIDTPQFQRLRYLHQIGSGYLVFPAADHSRFEHSLGVAHLAGELVKRLHNSQPELGITSADILCVQLAGLCHDLGHGPYSHLWECFLSTVNPGVSWRHESTSIAMLRHLIDSNPSVQVAFLEYQIYETDIEFICELIDGPQDPEDRCKTPTKEYWPFLGRSRDKSFLYQIVANKKNGVDVDKWDYFVRDSYYLGVRTSFDHNRLIKFAAVVDGEICFREKEYHNVLEMFHCRYLLHRTAYQHKTTKVLDLMLIRIFLLADEHVTLPGAGGRRLRLSECHTDMTAWTLLTDHIYQLIRSTDLTITPELAPAVDLIKRIETRKLYKVFGQAHLTDRNSVSPTTDGVVVSQSALHPDEIVRQVFCQNEDELLSLGVRVEDIQASVATISYGGVQRGVSPLEFVRFYSKNGDICRDGRSHMQPVVWEEKILRLLYSPAEWEPAQQTALAIASRRWCEVNCYKFKPANSNVDMTPMHHHNGESFTPDAKRPRLVESSKKALQFRRS